MRKLVVRKNIEIEIAKVKRFLLIRLIPAQQFLGTICRGWRAFGVVSLETLVLGKD